MTDYALLWHFSKQQDLKKHQTQWLQELIDTRILIIYWPSRQAAVPDALSSSPIPRDYIDGIADSEPSGVA